MRAPRLSLNVEQGGASHVPLVTDTIRSTCSSSTADRAGTAMAVAMQLV